MPSNDYVQPLTLKYRPRRFQDMTGQKSARVLLMRMIQTGKVPPALLLFGAWGSGKAQPLDAQVLTPTGFRQMGDLRVGDPVIDPEGQSSVVTGVFPQGEQDIYRVTFNDGTSCECTSDHLWPVSRPKRLGMKQSREYRFVNGLFETGQRQAVVFSEVVPLTNIRVPVNSRGGGASWTLKATLSSDLDFVETLLPVDPYLLGLLLGDGGIGGSQPMFTTADQELIDAVVAALPDGVSARVASCAGNGVSYRLTGGQRGGTANPLTLGLRELGIMGHLSSTKFVPEQYKLASAKTRLATLQGLLDTDGSATPGGAEFSSCSQQLRDDVVWLARSLGFRATVMERKIKGERVGGGEYFISYRAQLKRTPIQPELFRLSRKVEASARSTTRWSTGMLARRFVKIERVRRAEAQCISVSAPSRLYVTDDFIPTHNTTSARVVAAALNCEQEDPSLRPCGGCQTCKDVVAAKSSDVIEIDAASNGLVDDIRKLQQNLRFQPMGRYRVCILDEAHELTGKGQQTLLKLLEEPPPNVILILATTNPDRLLDTIASRCFLIQFRKITVDDIAERLEYIAKAEGIPLTSEMALAIADRSQGALRDAVMLLEQTALVGARTPEHLSVMLGDTNVALRLVEALANADYPGAYACAREGLESLPSPAELVGRVVVCLRRLLVLASLQGDTASAPLAPPAVEMEVVLAAKVPVARLIAALRVLWEYYRAVAPAADAFAAMDLVVAMLGQALSGPQSASKATTANLHQSFGSTPKSPVGSSAPTRTVDEILASARQQS